MRGAELILDSALLQTRSESEDTRTAQCRL